MNTMLKNIVEWSLPITQILLMSQSNILKIKFLIFPKSSQKFLKLGILDSTHLNRIYFLYIKMFFLKNIIKMQLF